MDSFGDEPLSLRQLGFWLAVVEEGSFTAGARRLSISQPALSQQIRALEQRIGGELLERLPTGVRPTAAGRALLPEARAVLVSAERALRVGRQALELEPGTLEIATMPTVAAGRLFASVGRWHERYPSVALRLREFTHRTRLEERVAAGFGDLAIGPKPHEWSGPCIDLGWDEFVAVLPVRDPLQHRPEAVALAQLASHSWVMYDAQNGLADLVAAVCRQAGLQPRRVAETSQVDHAARLAASGLGVALVPAKNVPSDLEWAMRHLDPPFVWRVAAYTRKTWSANASTFVDLLRSDDWQVPPAEAVDLTSAF